jgi:hypothetical protein
MNNRHHLLSVNWKKYFDVNNKTLYLYMTRYGEGIYIQMYNKLKYAIRMNLPYVTLIKFHNTEIVSIVYSCDYIVVLTHMLNICVKMEYYELCAEISKTIKRFDTFKKTHHKREKEIVLQ